MRSLLLIELLPRAYAAITENCTTSEDTYIGSYEKPLRISSWMSRGICVRANNVNQVCYKTLDSTLSNLNSLRAGEYNGAAGVLALLPTIGALLGAPTTEIWRLWTVVPFGGVIAMTLSFGGAILLVRVEDYENDLSNDKIALGSIVTLRAKKDKAKEGETKEKVEGLAEKIGARMRQDESQRLPKGHLAFRLVGMVLLFFGAQVAMSIVEQGVVLPWWCVSRWWMHLWYLLDNWVQLPFKKTWKLFVSDIPYDVTIQNGDNIVTMLEKPSGSVSYVLRQLGNLKAGTAIFHRSQQYTKPRNAVLVMVSVINNGEERIRSLLRLFTKSISIATFVAGTALFASVQLLALPVAVMTLTLVLAAGVYSRAITGWIVSGVNKTEPMLHHIIALILSLDVHFGQQESEDHVRKIQAEIEGHVFVEGRRVAYRSPWHLRLWGVLAEPFDLREVDMSEVCRKESGGTSPSEEDFRLSIQEVYDKIKAGKGTTVFRIVENEPKQGQDVEIFLSEAETTVAKLQQYEILLRLIKQQSMATNAEASLSPPPAHRRQSTPPSEVSSGNEDWDGEAAIDGETQGEGSSREQMVKKLVRLALACEYSRQPIRRADITAKGQLVNLSGLWL
ncbi:MAG: hypothetical protein Q9167_007110 [Letrouitia subvulpina]